MATDHTMRVRIFHGVLITRVKDNNLRMEIRLLIKTFTIMKNNTLIWTCVVLELIAMLAIML